MADTPVEKRKVTFSSLMENNKFVFGVSLIIAFFVWVLVAMYASPEESYTLYGVPVSISTENSIVAQKGYESFWQSDDVVDVTVTGPRYMITKLTNDDIKLDALLNNVDGVGVSTLTLKPTLKQYDGEVKISAISKTSIQVYFDVKKTKEFPVKYDDSMYSEHIAAGYKYSSSVLPVETVKLTGPESEINKIISVTATPTFSSTPISVSATLPAELNLEGTSVADTVSINKYITSVQDQKFYIKVNVDKQVVLKPGLSFLGEKTGNVTVKADPEKINALVDTESGFKGDELTVFSISYVALNEGSNEFTVKINKDALPKGVKITDDIDTVSFAVSYYPNAGANVDKTSR